MDYIITKIYEFLIRRKIKKDLHMDKVTFEYFLLVSRGFTMYYVKPNTRNRITVTYYYRGYNVQEYRRTFKNIKEAYKYFK